MIALLLVALAHAETPSVLEETAYDRTIDLIDRLFLYPDTLTAGKLLQAAATGVADQIHWLAVEPDGDNGVVLRHGDGTLIGSVTVANMTTLPAALRALEQVIDDAGYDLEGTDVRLEILKATTTALDRYSRVLAGEKLDRFDVRLKGTLVGVGATLRRTGNELVISELVPDGPAAHGGLRVGDVIVRIDGISTTNMEVRDAIERIRGEVDTIVTLTIRRGQGEKLDLTLTRAEVVVPNVRSEVLADDVGYLQIDHFSQRTVDNLLVELGELRDAGALRRGLVIDLRGNTGGSMKEAARTADQFLTHGLLLRTEGPDGQPVQNLQGRMDATRAGDEPAIPIVVLIDEQTASGSEILAGALFELDRAVLIGYPSYGKGTVQKIYNLDDDVRFKLTVAQYVLENDRKIAEGGLVPDAVLGDIEVDAQGFRYRGWEEPAAKVPWERVVPVVEIADADGRFKSAPRDFALEVARRTVLRAVAPCVGGAATACDTREATLSALHEVLPAMRAEQEARLAEAYQSRGVDWTAATDASDAPRPVEADATVLVKPDPAHPGEAEVIATTRNTGADPLHRLLIELECDTFEPWSGLVVPVGKVAPGATATGKVRVQLPAGIEKREDLVRVRLRADQRTPVALDDQILIAASPAIPRVAVNLRLAGEGDQRRAEVTLENPGAAPLTGLRLQFAYPGDVDLELLDAAATLDSLPGKGRATVPLSVRLGPAAPSEVLLDLEVTAQGGDLRLLEWPVTLRQDGTSLRYEAPRVSVKSIPVSSPPGAVTVNFTVTDERALDHVVVYANGNKVAWAGPGRGGRVDLKATIPVEAGANRVVVLAEDDQGVVTRRSFTVRGDGPGHADAGE